MGMTAHLVYSAFGETGPATTSPGMIRRIRDDLGFMGLLMTDDIGMQALSGTVPERGGASMAAGCDVILHCNGDLAERIADAVSQLVVHHLEVVEVDENEAHVGAVSRDIGERTLQLAVEAAAVEQAGQDIVGRLVRQLPVAVVSVIMYLEPASAVVWAAIFLSERPDPLAWLGVGLVVEAPLGRVSDDRVLVSSQIQQDLLRAQLLIRGPEGAGGVQAEDGLQPESAVGCGPGRVDDGVEQGLLELEVDLAVIGYPDGLQVTLATKNDLEEPEYAQALKEQAAAGGVVHLR